MNKGGLTWSAIAVTWAIAVTVTLAGVVVFLALLADRIDQLRKVVLGG